VNCVVLSKIICKKLLLVRDTEKKRQVRLYTKLGRKIIKKLKANKIIFTTFIIKNICLQKV